MADNSKVVMQMAIVLVVICFTIGAVVSEFLKSDAPCGKIQKKYHGKFENYESFQLVIDDEYVSLDEETWKDLNIGDLYCEK